MDFLDKVKYNFDKIGYIKKLINGWTPVDCKTEKDFEKSLYDYFHTNLGQIQITKQYSIGRIKADIVIENSIIIELKNKLTARNNYQRLIGQLMEYKQWEGSVIILLIGETDKNFVKELKEFMKREDNSMTIESDKYTLIEKL